jgi:uncharacterized protein
VRNLLIFILVLIVIWWVRRALQRPRTGRGRGGAAGQGRRQTPERMLACDHCGVHVPESEGVRQAGGFFCSEEHRRLGARRS